jgi:hypothetical protein
MGRNMFGGHPGAWDPKQPWQGWWGAIRHSTIRYSC